MRGGGVIGRCVWNSAKIFGFYGWLTTAVLRIELRLGLAGGFAAKSVVQLKRLASSIIEQRGGRQIVVTLTTTLTNSTHYKRPQWWLSSYLLDVWLMVSSASNDCYVLRNIPPPRLLAPDETETEFQLPLTQNPRRINKTSLDWILKLYYNIFCRVNRRNLLEEEGEFVQTRSLTVNQGKLFVCSPTIHSGK